MKIASDQVSAPVRISHSQNPVPDEARTSSRRSSRRSMSSAMAPTSARERVRRSRDDRSEAIEGGHHAAGRHVQHRPRQVERGQRHRRAFGRDEDRRVQDAGHQRGGQATRESADPGGEGHGPGQEDEPGLPAERLVESRLDHDRAQADRDAEADGSARPRRIAEMRQILAGTTQRLTSGAGERAGLVLLDGHVRLVLPSMDTTRRGSGHEIGAIATEMRLRCARRAAAVRLRRHRPYRTSVGRGRITPWPYHLSEVPMIRPLRIAQVAPPLERVPPRAYGGTERVVYELVTELDRAVTR